MSGVVDVSVVDVSPVVVDPESAVEPMGLVDSTGELGLVEVSVAGFVAEDSVPVALVELSGNGGGVNVPVVGRPGGVADVVSVGSSDDGLDGG